MATIFRNALAMISRSVDTYIFENYRVTELPVKDLIGICSNKDKILIYEKTGFTKIAQTLHNVSQQQRNTQHAPPLS